MNMLDVKELTWVEDSLDSVKKIAEKVVKHTTQNEAVKPETKSTEIISDEPQTKLSKMKAFVRKAVDCCIE